MDAEAAKDKAAVEQAAAAAEAAKDKAAVEQAAADLVALEAENAEPEHIDIITIGQGVIAGKGLVPIGSKHTILKSAYSEIWMVPDTKTADGIMEIDPKHRYTVNLSQMEPKELKVLLAKVGVKTGKKTMKRADMERMIADRLVEIAEDEAAKE